MHAEERLSNKTRLFRSWDLLNSQDCSGLRALWAGDMRFARLKSASGRDQLAGHQGIPREKVQYLNSLAIPEQFRREEDMSESAPCTGLT